MSRFVLTLTLGLTIAAASVAQAADVKTICNNGEAVEVTRHLAQGKFTLVDFYADWCGPCRSLEPTLKRLASQHSDNLALRKVNIVNWDSQVSRKYRLSSIPHLKLYGIDGTLIQEGGAGAVLAALEQRLGTGGGSSPGDSGGPGPAPFLVALVLLAGGAAWMFYGGRAKPTTVVAGPGGVVPHPFQGSADHANPDAVWFVMLQGTLEGPFSVEDLEDLKSRRCIDDNSQVRRRGDAEWQSFSDIT